MFSPEFMKFLLSKDVKVEKTNFENAKKEDITMVRFARFATSPIEVKE